MESALDAMVLGYSLKKSGTKYPYILLYTEDVDARLLPSLRYVGWTLRLTSYIDACDALLKHHHKSGRFAHVFTKLRALELVEFHKVLVLDTDLVIRRCIDDLFELRSPAAMKRGDSYEYRHGERIDGSHFFSGAESQGYRWHQVGGINAGVMLLKPDIQVFRQMLKEINDQYHPSHIAGHGPEQDYLSRFYGNEWTHISCEYNFQLHQMWYTLSQRQSLHSARKDIIHDPDRIRVVHYSGDMKPSRRFILRKYASYSDAEWFDEFLTNFDYYRAWVAKDALTLRKLLPKDFIFIDFANNLRRVTAPHHVWHHHVDSSPMELTHLPEEMLGEVLVIDKSLVNQIVEITMRAVKLYAATYAELRHEHPLPDFYTLSLNTHVENPVPSYVHI